MIKQPFYLTKRKLLSGRSVYYFYYYDIFGTRTVPRTTGYSKKQEAFDYCVNLVKRGHLSCDRTRFKSYAFGFFEKGSRWYANKMLTKEITEGTLKGYRSYFDNHIYPYFSETSIRDITTNVIREFRVYLSEEKQLSPKTINNIVDTLRIVLEWAVEDNIIAVNPVNKNLKPLSTETEREAFTYKEVVYLLNKDWGDYECWLYTLTAAITGLRFSEIAGLRRSSIYRDYIKVDKQYNGRLTDVKTKEPRFVPIPTRLSKMLLSFCKGEYVFYRVDDRTKPIPRTTVMRKFYGQYSEQMICQKNERLLTFHSLRHFFNTLLVSKDIQSQKIDFVMGHSAGKGSMQELYTTWKPEMYNDIRNIQEKLLDDFL